jgi:mono/diheme cytochrome c family protein
MRTVPLTTLFVMLISAAALSAASRAQAQQKYTISQTPNATSRFVQEHVIDVDDVPGHQLRVYEVRNEYPDKDFALAGVRVKELVSRGISDLVDRNGPFTAYNVYTLEDGDKVFCRLTGTTQGGKSVFVENFVGGTGKFMDIRGQMHGNIERAPGSKSLTVAVSGEYWFATEQTGQSNATEPDIPVSVADGQRGRLLYDTYCVACHTTQAHWRDKHIVQSWADLLYQVTRMQNNAGQQWSLREIIDVAAYLNEVFYKMPCPITGCLGSQARIGVGSTLARER